MKVLSKTTEYTLTIAVLIADIASALAGAISGPYAVKLASISIAAYAVARGLSKWNSSPNG